MLLKIKNCESHEMDEKKGEKARQLEVKNDEVNKK